MTTRVIAIIQARMNSSRLPGKVLLDIGGQPMLARVFARTSRASAIVHTLVATTTDATDDPIIHFCDASQIPFTRGSQFDVLDRYYQAATGVKAEVVVRITADCPVIDPNLIDEVAALVIKHDSGDDSLDFATNRLPPPWKRTFPIGLDTEVCTFDALERCWKEAKEPVEREHVMPYLYEGVQLAPLSKLITTGISPHGFKVALTHHDPDYGSYRWTVDTSEDLKFMQMVFSRFGGHDDFSWLELLDLVHREPQLMEINAKVSHKTLKDIDTRGLMR